MAWTPSAPRRGTLAAVTALVGGQQRRLSRAIAMHGSDDVTKGDISRGQTVIVAAWLGILGAAAPNISPLATAALLCASGAALLLFATPPSGIQGDHEDRLDQENRFALKAAAATQTHQTQITDLIEATEQDHTTSVDRAAFAKLTAHMSHELRTPLNAILGFSEIMSNEVFGPLGSSSYTGYAKDIHASGLTLLKSAEDALAITALLTSPSDVRRQATTSAANATNEAISFHAQAIAAKQLSISCTVDAEVEVHCDAQTSRQLVINLLDDAIAKAKSGTTIAVASRNVGNQLEILITIATTLTQQTAAADRFSMLLAQTLAELGGAQLSESCGGIDHQISVRFMRASQHELF